MPIGPSVTPRPHELTDTGRVLDGIGNGGSVGRWIGGFEVDGPPLVSRPGMLDGTDVTGITTGPVFVPTSLVPELLGVSDGVLVPGSGPDDPVAQPPTGTGPRASLETGTQPLATTGASALARLAAALTTQTEDCARCF